MGIPFTILMGFLFTMTMGILFTILLGIQFTISKRRFMLGLPGPREPRDAMRSGLPSRRCGLLREIGDPGGRRSPSGCVRHRRGDAHKHGAMREGCSLSFPR